MRRECKDSLRYLQPMIRLLSDISTGNEYLIKDFDEIVYCKAEGSYTRIHLTTGEILISKVLKCTEQNLPCEGFLRIHKSYLINVNFISGIKPHTIVLKTNDELPFARRKRSIVLKELSKKRLMIRTVKSGSSTVR